MRERYTKQSVRVTIADMVAIGVHDDEILRWLPPICTYAFLGPSLCTEEPRLVIVI